MNKLMMATVWSVLATAASCAWAQDHRPGNGSIRDGSYMRPQAPAVPMPRSIGPDSPSTRTDTDPESGKRTSDGRYGSRTPAASYTDNDSWQRQPQSRPPDPFGNR